MIPPRHLIRATVLALALNACAAQTAMHPHIDRNPHPTDAWRLRVVIHDPPGALAPYDAATEFNIRNLECAVVEKHPMHANQPVENEPFEVRKVADNTYEAVFHKDALLDKDYFGNGVCHWYAASPSVSFKAGAGPEFSAFIIALSVLELHDGFREVVYFDRGDYPRNSTITHRYVSFGTTDRASWKMLKDDQLFRMDVSLDKVAAP